MQKIYPTVPDLRCVRCAYDRAVTLTRVPRTSISAVRCHGSYTVYESDSFNDSEIEEEGATAMVVLAYRSEVARRRGEQSVRLMS